MTQEVGWPWEGERTRVGETVESGSIPTENFTDRRR
jgi:hypothetical protein